MEIPIVELELYDRNPSYFSQRLGRVLEDLGVAQVDGLEQGLVDSIYRQADAIFKEYAGKFNQANEYNVDKGMGRNELLLDPHFISGKRFQKFHQFYLMAGQLKANLDSIYETVKDALQTHVRRRLDQVRQKELYLFQYYDSDEKKELHVGPHKDGQIIVLAPRATGEGLERFVHGEQDPWQPLEPNHGHVLILPGAGLEKQQADRKILALNHRVKKVAQKHPRKALLYGA